MPLADEIKLEHCVVEIYDLAVSNLVVDCNVSFVEAASLLLTCCARQLTPGAVSEALKATAK